MTFGDVWAGEVWVASGQSNMEFPLQRSKGGADAAALGCSGLRLFTVANPPAAAPVTKAGGEWRLCDAANAAGFSAAAFHFGRELAPHAGRCRRDRAGVGGRHARRGVDAARGAARRADAGADDRDARSRDERQGAARRAGQEAGRLGGEELPPGPGEPRREERLGARRRRPLGDDGDPAAVGERRAGRRRGDLVSPRGDRARGVGGRRAGAVAGRDRRLRRHLLERRAHRRHGQRDAAILVGAAALPGARAAGEGRAQRDRGARVRSLRRRRLRGDARADEPAPGGGRGPGRRRTAPLPLAGTWSYKIERKLKPAVADWNTRPKLLGTDDPSSPTVLWNALVAPLVGLPIAGVIWYQGESNVERASQYRTLFPR